MSSGQAMSDFQFFVALWMLGAFTHLIALVVGAVFLDRWIKQQGGNDHGV